jgi:hypothetical protein
VLPKKYKCAWIPTQPTATQKAQKAFETGANRRLNQFAKTKSGKNCARLELKDQQEQVFHPKIGKLRKLERLVKRVYSPPSGDKIPPKVIMEPILSGRPVGASAPGVKSLRATILVPDGIDNHSDVLVMVLQDCRKRPGEICSSSQIVIRSSVRLKRCCKHLTKVTL